LLIFSRGGWAIFVGGAAALGWGANAHRAGGLAPAQAGSRAGQSSTLILSIPSGAGGYFSFMPRMVRTIVSLITQLRNHLWFDGTTYHGACGVEHFRSASS
jgi:hypothetical protein